MKKKNIKRINKTANIVLMTFIFVMAFNILSGSIIANGEAIDDFNTLTVESGDTLWTIAKDLKTNDDDIREIIYNIKELNQLTSDVIHPGQLLKVPSK